MLFNTKLPVYLNFFCNTPTNKQIEKLQKNQKSFYVEWNVSFGKYIEIKSTKPWWHKLWSFYGKQLTKKNHKYRNPFESFSITSFSFFFGDWIKSRITPAQKPILYDFSFLHFPWFESAHDFIIFMYFKENPCGKNTSLIPWLVCYYFFLKCFSDLSF